MALHKVREGKGWKILSEKEYQDRQESGFMRWILWTGLRLFAGFWLSVKLIKGLGIQNGNIEVVILLGMIILVFVITGKIKKRWFSADE